MAPPPGGGEDCPRARGALRTGLPLAATATLRIARSELGLSRGRVGTVQEPRDARACRSRVLGSVSARARALLRARLATESAAQLCFLGTMVRAHDHPAPPWAKRQSAAAENPQASAAVGEVLRTADADGSNAESLPPHMVHGVHHAPQHGTRAGCPPLGAAVHGEVEGRLIGEANLPWVSDVGAKLAPLIARSGPKRPVWPSGAYTSGKCQGAT